MSRIEGKVRQRPRVWDKVEPSVEIKLRDKLWLVRDKETGWADSSPITTPVELGPYKADLSTPDSDEVRERDRYQRETTHTAVAMMDEEPTTGDRVRVHRHGGPVEHFRLENSVKDREMPWGGVFLWHLELAKTEEF